MFRFCILEYVFMANSISAEGESCGEKLASLSKQFGRDVNR